MEPQGAAFELALIDSGAQANYINPRFVNQYNLPIRLKKTPYIIRNFEGRKVAYDNRWVRYKTILLHTSFDSHLEDI